MLWLCISVTDADDGAGFVATLRSDSVAKYVNTIPFTTPNEYEMGERYSLTPKKVVKPPPSCVGEADAT